MSDMHEDRLGVTGKTDKPRPLRWKEAGGHRDMFVPSFDATEFDEVVTSNLPFIDMSRLSNSMELRAIPVLFPPFQATRESAWITDQPTWMLPAVLDPTKAGKQASLPRTQGSATANKQASSGAQGYLSLALEMIKNSGIYALGALASPLVSLILTPFLAHHLSTTDYGALSVLYTVVDLVTVMTQLGISAAFFRAYNGDYESSRDRLGVLSSTIILLSLVSIPIAIVMMIAAPWLSELLFSTPSFSDPVRITALIIIMENLTLPGISWLRAERRAIFYSVLSVANLLIVLGTNIVLVGMLHVSLEGALIAKGAGYALMVACTLPMILLLLVRKHNLHLRSDIVRSMLFFGVPTIFSDIAAWVLQLSDRYLLSHFGSLAQTASYSVAYTLGGVLSPVLLAPWGLAWVPIMYSVAKRDDAAHIFKLVFRWWSTVLLFAAFALSLLSTLVLEALFPPAYRAAEPIIPMITLSTMLTGVWFIFMIGVNIRRKTIFEFIYMLIASSVNLLLNIFFIPRFGAMGAGVSTLLAYALLVVVSYIVNQKIYPIEFEVGSFSFKLVVGAALYVGSSLLAHAQRPLVSWSISIVALIVYGVFLVWLAGLSVKRLIKTFGYVQAAFRKELKKTHA